MDFWKRRFLFGNHHFQVPCWGSSVDIWILLFIGAAGGIVLMSSLAGETGLGSAARVSEI